MLYGRCTNCIISISKKYEIRFDYDMCIHQQLNNIEVYHIYIFNIAEYNAYSPAIQSKINNVS